VSLSEPQVGAAEARQQKRKATSRLEAWPDFRCQLLSKVSSSNVLAPLLGALTPQLVLVARTAFLVCATLNPSCVVLGLPTVASLSNALAPSSWTNSAANAAAAPFHSEPGAPFIGNAARSASTFAATTKSPPLEARWSDPAT
jgi:hypothetical protein